MDWEVRVKSDLPVRVRGTDFSDAELADVTRNLRDDLLSLPIEEAAPAEAGSPPPGSKSIEALIVGALIIRMSPQMIGAVIDVVASWLKRQHAGIEIEIDGQRYAGTMTREERAEIVAAYLARVTPAGES